MTQINNLPDQQEALNKMRIMDELRKIKYTGTNAFSNSISIALIHNISGKELFSFIRESAEDNYNMVADCIGVELLEEILNLKN